MSLQKIRLELARTPEQPEGNSDCGYEFIAPVDAKGHLDAKHWARDQAKCTVRRFWAGQPDEHGRLVHHRGANWVFAYAPWSGDEEPIFRLDRHAFAAGSYVSVTEQDGVQRPFRVVGIEPA